MAFGDVEQQNWLVRPSGSRFLLVIYSAHVLDGRNSRVNTSIKYLPFHFKATLCLIDHYVLIEVKPLETALDLPILNGARNCGEAQHPFMVRHLIESGEIARENLLSPSSKKTYLLRRLKLKYRE